ncbi:cation:proton antiporter [Alicyclobacillus dauci]|uniref:Cation:proton antiporter n=1 Tax=Alicyclobacillus dauci TaxID=1475485 RepID=A0ABY6Z6D1_9BACL|nr:cation:proton antiporter [Alicyclobacillus dauci]WAH38442.1 cation:proton antiporter [Alicyclobacillus dauci]
MSDTLFVFLVILAASFVFSTLLSRIPLLRIPSTVGYLMFGMVLQSKFIHITDSEIHWLNHLADFGLLFLMYVSGMEVDVRQLRPSKWTGRGPSILSIGLSIFCATLLISFGVALWMYRLTPPPTNPYMVALLFSTTSLGVILPILEESHLLHKQFGQTLLVSALIADFLTMLLLSIFISGQTAGSPSQVLLTLAIVPFAIGVYIILRGVQRLPWLRNLAGDVQVRIRAIIALLAVTTALADFTGAEPILGSFLVGMLVSALPFSLKGKLRDYSHGIGYGFFIPLFFISVGLDFDFHSLRSHEALMWIPVLIVAAFVVKLIPSLYLVRGFGWRKSLAGGFLLSARLSLIAAAAQIGVRIGTLSHVLADSIILVAIITSMIGPILFVALYPTRTGT